MGRTVIIHGSDEVLAMFGSKETFYKGKWERVKVTQIGPDENTPLEIRKSLVGLVIPTIFTKESIEEQTGASFSIPEGSRLAYPIDVIEALNSAGKEEVARQFKELVPGQLDMYVLEKGIYELV